MPQMLTLEDTRNLTGSFIPLQWKHEVFNSKNVSITFRDFFPLWHSCCLTDCKREEFSSNSLILQDAKAFLPRAACPQPLPRAAPRLTALLSFLQRGAFLTRLALPLTCLFLFLWK